MTTDNADDIVTRWQADWLARHGAGTAGMTTAQSARYGKDIFSGPGPTTWEEYIGQERAKAMLRACIASAQARGVRLGHTLIAAGQYGAGKSALARLIAAEMGVGIVELSGKIKVDEARPILRKMKAGDILFIDEFHAMVSGGKGNAEWLLHLLEDGRLLTAKGSEPMPDITVIAATTDVGRLPETILSRFPVKPVLVTYSLLEARQIAFEMAKVLSFDGENLEPLSENTADAVSLAANRIPRDIRQLLTLLRDAAYAGQARHLPDGDRDLSTALRWAGVTADGLSEDAQRYLMALLVDFDGRAGEKTIAAALGEPGPLRHVEKLLLTKGLIVITPTGRQLTDRGADRTAELLTEVAA